MIRINEDYIIDVDDYCYTLKRDKHKTTVRDGKESMVTEIIGHYATLENALKGYLSLRIKKRHAGADQSVYDALTVIGEERAAFERLLKMYARGAGK